MLPARLHASTRRGEPLTTVHVTGEVRVPLALYAVDERRGDVDLVLSRTEAHRLFTQLAEALGLVHSVPAPRGLEAVR
ncbi:hypothetical protein [Streptomyces sp.]|uniref:hypothetical protein n=1 Tax=Streptomyces sp. TaxID=1931 RepID=UPI002D38C22D|nr:hypothetical protein [Streptomyces sp.]HZF92091.1 hypothetical protein [Streptomyces sp.]